MTAASKVISPSGFAVTAIGVVALFLGLLLGSVGAPLIADERFRRDFFTSAGFAGLAALAAAIVAYAAARHTASSSRSQAQADRLQSERARRKAQWWARAEWALTQVATGDGKAAIIGLGVLDALSQSEWADEHEGDVVAAATDIALNASEVSVDADERPGAGDTESAGSQPSTWVSDSGTMEEGGDDD